MPTDIYTSSGAHTWRDGTAIANIDCVSGGRGGGSTIDVDNGDGTFTGGVGGKGGSYAKKIGVDRTGASETVTVGDAGFADDGMANDTLGGDTWFIDTSTVLAAGTGSAGDCIGDTVHSGGAGGTALPNSSFGNGGGGGQAGSFGGDGAGGASNSSADGDEPGGGGHGALTPCNNDSSIVTGAIGRGGQLSVFTIAGNLHFVQQPTNIANGGAFSPSVKVEIRDLYGVRDTGATGDVTIVGGGGFTVTGTTTVAAVAGLATFGGLGAVGSGTGFSLQASHADCGTADSSTFNISGDASIGPFLLRKIRRRKAPPFNYGKNAVRHVIIPTGTKPVPIARNRRTLDPQPRTKRALVPVNTIQTLTTLLPMPAKIKRSIEPRTQRRTAIVPGAVAVRPIPLQRFRGQRTEVRSQRKFVPLPGKQTTPVVLQRTRGQAPVSRSQKKTVTLPTLSQATLLPTPGKTRTRIVERRRKVTSQFPAPLRNVPILMPPKKRLVEVTRRQRGVVPLAIRAPGLPIMVPRIKRQGPEVRTQKRVVPLSLPARQTPVMVRRYSRGGMETRRQRSIVNVGMKTTSALPVIVARKSPVRLQNAECRIRTRLVPVAARSGAIVLPGKKQRTIETRTVRKAARFPGTGAAGSLVIVARKSAVRIQNAECRIRLRPVPVASRFGAIVLPAKKQRTIETRTVRKAGRFPAGPAAVGGLVIVRKMARSQGPVISKTKLRPLPVASLSVSAPVVVPGRRRVQTIVVRRSAVRIIPAGAGSKNVVVHTTKKTW